MLKFETLKIIALKNSLKIENCKIENYLFKSMSLLKLKLVTPQRVLVDEQVSKVSLPTTLGEITILPGHAPLVSDVNSGELVFEKDGVMKSVYVAGGVVEVALGNKVTMLVDEAEHLEELDVAKIEEAKIRAEKTMNESVLSDEEYVTAVVNLERSLSRLRFVRKHGKRAGKSFESSN
jgi:F-type H+-transporting ATPase subunit epsilon